MDIIDNKTFTMIIPNIQFMKLGPRSFYEKNGILYDLEYALAKSTCLACDARKLKSRRAEL